MNRMNWTDRIAIDPGVLTGKPVIRGTRLAVDLIVGLLAQDWSQADIIRNYPGITHADIAACLSRRSADRGATDNHSARGDPCCKSSEYSVSHSAIDGQSCPGTAISR